MLEEFHDETVGGFLLGNSAEQASKFQVSKKKKEEVVD
jgi:hypothetical protein